MTRSTRSAGGTALAARPRKSRARRARFTARTADKFDLYQRSVQSPEHDIVFLTRQYKKVRGREPLRLREDFCGTALLCATWVKGRTARSAEGFDLDHETLEWGRAHNLEPLGAAARRVALHQEDVRARGLQRPDVRVAQNFSYYIFKTRDELRGYFRAVHQDLAPGGMFACDLYGGTEATEELQEERKIEGGFTYVWDQHRFLPGTSDYTCYIHFRFRDGTEMKRAFSYHWRLWTMPEVKELLAEAGFKDVRSYFEQSEGEDGEGNGVYKQDETGRSARDCAGWLAYLLAFK